MDNANTKAYDGCDEVELFVVCIAGMWNRKEKENEREKRKAGFSSCNLIIN